MIIYKILARLIDYPTTEMIENISEVRTLVAEDASIAASEKEAINEFVSWMEGQDLLRIQENYVNTFDMVPEHDLHLTHHIFGDDRGRGPALVDLSEHYKAAGLEVAEKEIPDFLPLILEYVSTLDDMGARVFLGDAAKVITVLAANLEKAESPYAKLIRIVDNRGHLAQAA
ncbi:MAG: nitrate reductase molybdenum cofactor assembly chaperone [Gammaproteobacteria bacterium]|nr:nitrate reductase molybdenum cofactor assembly chaperone [Gammaproteobacteria bacterium]MCW8982884.1 nitrate reductase molybdenum cofactor assembly chaperone [Gammaproteobacteria bacterium]